MLDDGLTVSNETNNEVFAKCPELQNLSIRVKLYVQKWDITVDFKSRHVFGTHLSDQLLSIIVFTRLSRECIFKR